MIQITIDDREVRAALERLSHRLADLTPAMAGIATALHSESERQFEQEAGPEGSWPELKPSTRRAREKRGTWPGKKLQVSSGGLAASVTPEHGASFAALVVTKRYAAIHQFGGQAGRGRKANIPPRPYLPLTAGRELSPSAAGLIVEVLRKHLDPGSL
ncbi:MAG TPA: phage virion morphogenesis protein [Methylococcus sp.]|nr:phage virion morphogenesis protein [Methylococcus sp.]